MGEKPAKGAACAIVCCFQALDDEGEEAVECLLQRASGRVGVEGDESLGAYALDRESLVGETVAQLFEQVLEEGIG